jgi:DNA-binding transcriptional MerR regulator
MKIAEVSKKMNISSDTLRYYERIGLVPRIKRNKNGIRSYTEKDCRWINFIRCMRNAGLSIEVLIEYLDLLQQGHSTLMTRKKLLVNQRDQLTERIKDTQATLKRLNIKIEWYDDVITKGVGN